MPNLRCSASDCVHNNDECCCRGAIDVAGSQACTSDDTCCSSFCHDGGGAHNAVSDEPILNADVKCKAEKCTYNNNCICNADSIQVNGYAAIDSLETACSTFYPK